MKRGIIVLIVTLAWSVTVNAQPDTVWTHLYGGDRGDWGHCLRQTPDGGYILTGIYDANLFMRNQYLYLVKTDEFGNLEWEQTIHSELQDTSFIGRGVEVTADGGTIVVGDVMNPFIGLSKVYLLKLDQEGNLQWERTYWHGCPWEGCRGEAVKQTEDGGYILAGSTIYDGAIEGDFYLIKTDPSGNEEWSMNYGGSGIEFAYDVAQADDGGYVVVGTSTTYASGYSDVWVLKTDASGVQEWAINFGGEGEDEEGWGIVKTEDGCYVVTGNTYAFESVSHSDVFLAKIDPDGNLLWFEDLDGTIGYSLDQTDDGGFIVSGVFENITDTRDLYIVKTDAEGNTDWSMTLDDDGHWEVPYSVIQAEDGSYVVCGSYSTNFPYSNDVFLTKYGEITPADLSLVVTPYNPPITIPATGGAFDFNVSVENNEATSVLFDLWTSATLPDSSQFGPIYQRDNIVLTASAMVEHDFTQNVPGNAPGGSYTYNVYLGVYPDDVWVEDHFTFAKSSPEGQNGAITDWTCRVRDVGESDVNAEASLPATLTLMSVHPNPFNPATTFKIELPVASWVALEIFGVGGRSLGFVLDGWRNAGYHEVTFDGSGLASGVYIYLIEVGEFRASGKMVLMK